MFGVRFQQPLATDAAASRAHRSPEEEVFPLRQVQLCDARQGALHETRQVSLDADDQVRSVRVSDALQVESGPSSEESHGRRHVQVLALQLHGSHQAESHRAHSESSPQSR